MNRIDSQQRYFSETRDHRLVCVRSMIWIASISMLISFALPAIGNAADERWDVEFTGIGDPADAGWTHHGNNYHSLYSRFSPPNLIPGWVTGTGNAGGYWSMDLPKVLTTAKGWTIEWAMQAANDNPRPLIDRIIQIQDDVSRIQVGYDTKNNRVVIGDDSTNRTVAASVKLFDGTGNQTAILHIYRLVRQPGSKTVELYIDDELEHPALQLEVSGRPGSSRGAITKIFDSGFESAWDFWRARAGATVSRPTEEAPPHILGAADQGEKPDEGYRIYTVSPAINNQALLVGKPLPSSCTDATTINVMCARGEYEPGSFVVEALRPLKQVMVSVGRLQNDAGASLPPESVDVRIAQKFYRSTTWGCVTMPWVLVHDPQMMKIVDKHPKWVTEITEEAWKAPGGVSLEEYKAGYSKINQLVKELIDTDTLQPGDVDDFQQFWLTVHIPKDAKAGVYKGDVTITATNAEPSTLALEVTVPSFDLLPPPFEYSVYYPTQLERPDTTDDQRQRYNPITEQQYLAENRNMAMHGCTNPCIYVGPEQDEAGRIHFTQLTRILQLRESAGMPKGGVLYLMDGAGMSIKTGKLTEQEKQRNIAVAKATVEWAKSRGYSGALFMGADEFSGDSLRAMRDSYASIQAGGSGIWVAGWADLVNFMSDVVANPIFAHPGAMGVDQYVQWQVDPVEWLLHPDLFPNWDPQLLLAPEYQQLIKTAHQRGNKVFTYFDPQGGQPFPEYHRRHRGMGLWKTGLDGTMTWAYIHIWTPTVRLNDPRFEDGVPYSGNAFVVRGPEGVLDTLGWEGYREGYDDARYLATLKEAMAKATAERKHADLVADTRRWLDHVGVDANLNEWRAEMARRTKKLLQR